MNSLNEIRARVIRDGIGRTELSAASGLHSSSVQRLLDDDDANPTLETLTKLSTGIEKIVADREAEARRILNPAATATAGEG